MGDTAGLHQRTTAEARLIASNATAIAEAIERLELTPKVYRELTELFRNINRAARTALDALESPGMQAVAGRE